MPEINKPIHFVNENDQSNWEALNPATQVSIINQINGYEGDAKAAIEFSDSGNPRLFIVDADFFEANVEPSLGLSLEPDEAEFSLLDASFSIGSAEGYAYWYNEDGSALQVGLNASIGTVGANIGYDGSLDVDFEAELASLEISMYKHKEPELYYENGEVEVKQEVVGVGLGLSTGIDDPSLSLHFQPPSASFIGERLLEGFEASYGEARLKMDEGRGEFQDARSDFQDAGENFQDARGDFQDARSDFRDGDILGGLGSIKDGLGNSIQGVVDGGQGVVDSVQGTADYAQGIHEFVDMGHYKGPLSEILEEVEYEAELSVPTPYGQLSVSGSKNEIDVTDGVVGISDSKYWELKQQAIEETIEREGLNPELQAALNEVNQEYEQALINEGLVDNDMKDFAVEENQLELESEDLADQLKTNIDLLYEKLEYFVSNVQGI